MTETVRIEDTPAAWEDFNVIEVIDASVGLLSPHVTALSIETDRDSVTVYVAMTAHDDPDAEDLDDLMGDLDALLDSWIERELRVHVGDDDEPWEGHGHRRVFRAWTPSWSGAGADAPGGLAAGKPGVDMTAWVAFQNAMLLTAARAFLGAITPSIGAIVLEADLARLWVTVHVALDRDEPAERAIIEAAVARLARLVQEGVAVRPHIWVEPGWRSSERPGRGHRYLYRSLDIPRSPG